LRQSLEERVRPILFINKVDRLVKELKLSPQEVQKKLTDLIMEVNNLIEMYAEPEFKEQWRIRPELGNVVFGSAKDKWGFTVPMAAKKGVKFSDVVNAYSSGDKSKIEELSTKSPIHEALLDTAMLPAGISSANSLVAPM